MKDVMKEGMHHARKDLGVLDVKAKELEVMEAMLLGEAIQAFAIQK